MGAAAVTLDFTPTEDGDVSRGLFGDLISTTGPTMSFSNGGLQPGAAVMEFDLSAIPDGATINSASVMLTRAGTFNSSLGSSVIVGLVGYNGDGVVDFNDLDAIGTGMGAVGVLEGDVVATLSIGLTDLAPIEAALLGDLFTIRVGTGTAQGGVLATSESTTLAGPKLSVDFTPAVIPLPASAWLLMAGLGGLAALRRPAPSTPHRACKRRL
ncbi:MAG: VPLPA-CTERM sorting domain-containing protein [Pseudomonadota bacterium]